MGNSNRLRAIHFHIISNQFDADSVVCREDVATKASSNKLTRTVCSFETTPQQSGGWSQGWRRGLYGQSLGIYRRTVHVQCASADSITTFPFGYAGSPGLWNLFTTTPSVSSRLLAAETMPTR